MSGKRTRVINALNHSNPDRTPLFEIFQPYHPIHWDICGRNIATDMAMAWDAMADGVDWQELVDAQIKAQYTIRRYFDLDMVRLNGAPKKDYERPIKAGPGKWTLGGLAYHVHPRTQLVELEDPTQAQAMSSRESEEDTRRMIEEWDGLPPALPAKGDPVLEGVRTLADADGVDWVYMGEVGAGTGAAF